jgi:hypothetical protein
MTANFIQPTQISIPAEFLTPLYGLIPSFLIPFVKGKINDSGYDMLKDKISEYYGEKINK